MPSGTGPVLKGQLYHQTAVQFGCAQILQFPSFELDANGTVQPGAQIALPCNVKVLALAVNGTGQPGVMQVGLGSGLGATATSVATQPDNFNISTPSSAFVGSGQLGAPMAPVGIATTGAPNNVVYAPLFTNAGQPGVGAPGGPTPVSIPYWDMIFPCTRPLVLYYTITIVNPVTVNASALVVPIILDPNQPYPYAGMWVPNQTNMGAPSTA